jgi:hypothetical protein
MGCGPGVYVPRHAVEAQVFQGLDNLLDRCGDAKRFVHQVNAELRDLWKRSTASDVDSTTAPAMIAKINSKIQNLRNAVEDGFYDASWANARLRELMAERESLTARVGASKPPTLDLATIMSYRHTLQKVFNSGEPAERKRLLRTWVQGIKLQPESLEVKISYRLPESVMKGVVAGACTGPNAPVIPFQFELRHAAA